MVVDRLCQQEDVELFCFIFTVQLHAKFLQGKLFYILGQFCTREFAFLLRHCSIVVQIKALMKIKIHLQVCEH